MVDIATIRAIGFGLENLGPEPELSIKSLPEWYKKHPRYDTEGKSLWRNCVPLFDAMTFGYVLLTPEDITFKKGPDRVHAEIDPESPFLSFISERESMDAFKAPLGYDNNHYAWLPRWGFELNPGYSAIYTTPFNRFDLPFINTTGIIDNDKMSTPGNMPFFLRDGWTGVIPKGTPFVQVIPFKREEWSLIVAEPNPFDSRRQRKLGDRFRSVKADYYRDKLWTRKRFKKDVS